MDKRIPHMIAYIPFVGWLYTLTVADDDVTLFHGQQALFLAIIFSLVPATLYISELLFVPQTARLFRLILVVGIYVSHGIYLIALITAAVMAYMEKRLTVPFFHVFAEKVPMQ